MCSPEMKFGPVGDRLFTFLKHITSPLIKDKPHVLLTTMLLVPPNAGYLVILLAMIICCKSLLYSRVVNRSEDWLEDITFIHNIK